MSINKDFDFALVGGILVIITGIIEYIYNVSLIFWKLSFVGVLFGIFMVLGALLMKYKPYGISSKNLGIARTTKFPVGGFICLICSIVSLAFLQGLLIGPMLGIVAGTSNYAKIYKSKR
jgi:hypothetical protein